MDLLKKKLKKVHVISKQAVNMEKKELIKRVQDSPNSKLLRLELTEKGYDKITVTRYSKAMNKILSNLTEEERQQLHSILNRMLINANEYIPK